MKRAGLTNLHHFRYAALHKSDAKSGEWVVIGKVISDCFMIRVLN
jgi:hypothetical protein